MSISKFFHHSIFAMGSVATAGVLTASIAMAATVTTNCSVRNVNPLDNDFDMREDLTTDRIISGPIGVNSSCRYEDSLSVFRGGAWADSISDFGAFSSVFGIEGGGVSQSEGRIQVAITRQNASTTEIPFTISNLTLNTVRGNTSAAEFKFQVSEELGSSSLVEATGKFTLSPLGEFEIVATDQTGFEEAASSEDDVRIGVIGVSQNGVPGIEFRDRFTYKAQVLDYTGSLNIRELDVGKEYFLDYFFKTEARGNFADVFFTDPLSPLGQSGIDPDVLAALTSSATPTLPTNPSDPSVVPLPASSLLLLSGLSAMAFGARRRRKRAA